MTSLSPRLSGNQRFDFVSDAYDADTFAVVRMHGHEGLSRLYRFELILVSDDAQIDFDKMLQQQATFQILAPDDATKNTPYSGMLAEFDQLHQAGGYTFYRAVLVPRMWRLSQTRTSEVYLNEQTIPQIIEALLRDAQLSGTDVDLKLTGDYRPRSYVCQYQESHFDFISRWMEKEGMYYYFAQSGSADTLSIVDDVSMHAADTLAVNYRPADELDTGSEPDSVQGLVCQQRPLPNKVVLQDYNYRKASVPLEAETIVSSTGYGEVVFYNDNFRDADEGRRYATFRAQELMCGGKVFAGEATAVGLRSGYFMQISHHYRDDFNGKYLVTEIRHEGSQAGALLAGIKTPYSTEPGRGEEIAYRNSFRAIPAAVQYRTPRVTPKPRIAGTMNAMVDAEGSGQYADLDEYGQYKVQLPFDRTDKAAVKGSARMRMATPYSGDGHGMHFPLLKNAEVLLSFTDGDPDQPVIVGTVSNSVNSNVVDQTNPAQNRIVTSGGNQLQFTDTQNQQSVWMYSPSGNTHIIIGGG
jgi:type VI secretion system secreted protein VgrG